MAKIKKVFNIISNALVYSIGAIVIATIILFAGGIKPFVTMSGSMETHIKTGSVCFVNTKADYYDMQVGDVIAFETSTGKMVTHRIISITDEGMETKGDANNVSDGISTTADNFRGKNLFSVPYVGYGIVYMKQPQSIAIVFVLVVAFILLGMVDDEEYKEENGKRKGKRLHREE